MKNFLFWIATLTALSFFSGCGAQSPQVVKEELTQLSLSPNYRTDILYALSKKHSNNGCSIQQLQISAPQKSFTNGLLGLTVYHEGVVKYQVYCPVFARINPNLVISNLRKSYHIYKSGEVYFY